MDKSKKDILVQHEERFYIAHSKCPFTKDICVIP